MCMEIPKATEHRPTSMTNLRLNIKGQDQS